MATSNSSLREPVVVDTKIRETIPAVRVVIILLLAWISTLGSESNKHLGERHDLTHIILAGYLFSIQLLLTSSGIYTSAPAGRLLLIPNIASQAALFISLIFMTLVAFKIGAEWMKAMGNNDNDIDKSTEDNTKEDKTNTETDIRLRLAGK